MLDVNIPEQRPSPLAVTARLGTLSLVQIVTGVALALLILKREVDVWGLESGGDIGLGSPVAADLLVWVVVPTLPPAFEAWTAASGQLRWLGLIAAALASTAQTWLGMWPVSFRLSGMRDPVTRPEVSEAFGSCATLLLVHLSAVVLLTATWRWRARRRLRIARANESVSP